MNNKRILLYILALAAAGGLVYFLWVQSPRQRQQKPALSSGPSHKPTTRPGSSFTMPPTGSQIKGMPISGKVKDGTTGAPIAGALLVFRESSNSELGATADGKGLFRLEAPAGIYQVSVWAEDYASSVLPQVVVQEGKAISGLDFMLYRTGTIGGRVVDTKLHPLAGVRVQIQRVRGSARYEMVSMKSTTDSQGRFSIKVPPAQVTLRADHAQLGSALSKPIFIRAGVSVTGVEIMLGGGMSLSGRVIAQGGKVITGGQVWIKDELGRRKIPCDKEGRFAVGGLAAGNKYVQAEAPGYAPSQIMMLQLHPGESPQIILEVGASQGVGGRVLSEDGKSVAGAKVTAQVGGVEGKLMQLVSFQETVTDENGKFQFKGLANLPILLTATGPRKSGFVSRAGVPPGTFDIELRLQRTGSIAGMVTDGVTGKPIQDYTIYVKEGPKGKLTGRPLRTVSADGQFLIEDLVPGTYTLIFTATGYGAVTKSGISLVAGYYAQTNVVLDVSGSVSGIVVDERGVSIPGASVRIDSGWYGHSVITDATGAFLIKNVARGLRSLTVKHPDYDTRIVSGVSVFPEKTAQVRVDLNQRKGQKPSLRLTGIGASLANRRAGLVVVETFPGSPAEAAGLKPGDMVLAIDGLPASQMSFADGIESLRGIAGTPVRLRIKRQDRNFELYIIRGEVNAPAS